MARAIGTYTITDVYDGEAGEDAKVVKINPSSQVFKSMAGAEGTFLPQYIYLYPSFQNCTYSSWQYSINGVNWYTVNSSTDGVSVGTYDSVANTLRLERNSALLDSTSSVSFKCLSSDAYDTVTISKVYDVEEIKIGARNLVLLSGDSKEATNEVITYDLSAYGIYNLPGKQVAISFDIEADDDDAMCTVYLSDASGNPVTGTSKVVNTGTTEQRISYVGLVPANQELKWFCLDSTSGSVATKFTIKNVKVETGNVNTDWTPAPEDNMVIIPSPTAPTNPEVGTGWFNTSNGDTLYWDGTSWIVRDLSQYVTEADISSQVNTKNTVYIEQPEVPYYKGDIWIVTSGPDNGKMKTCLQTRTSGSYTESDWFTPLTAYTTVTDMTNVIGTDPSQWDVTSKSITTLINEANNAIESVSSQASKLAVRASDIEMSFSITGTMNFLGNSSGQNSLQLWTQSRSNTINTASANEASDVRSQLVSGSSFYFNQNWGPVGSSTTVSFTSNLLIPPTGDNYTVSLKLKNQSRYSSVTLRVYHYSDAEGNDQISTKYIRIPYAYNSTGLFYLEHMVVAKEPNVSRIKVVVSFSQQIARTISALPEYNSDYMGLIRIVDGQGYWGASEYSKVTILTQETIPDSMTDSQVWYCTKDTPYYSDFCLAGFYYEMDTRGLLVPITDSYIITMLDQDNYWKRVPTNWEEVENVDEDEPYLPGTDPIYFGDIMVNGGTMVQTWTPRQDENLWGDNIKFSSSGITIENRGNMTKRTLDESSDISYVMNTDGSIKKILWKLTSTGFIVEDILCKGEFSMGYVPSQYDGDNEHIVENFRKVITHKRNSSNTGVDEYIYDS